VTVTPTLTAVQELQFSQAKQNADAALAAAQQSAQFGAQAASQQAAQASASAAATFGATKAELEHKAALDRKVLPADFAQRGVIRSGMFPEAITDLYDTRDLNIESADVQRRNAASAASMSASLASQSAQLQMSLAEQNWLMTQNQVDAMREATMADLLAGM
jgi:hypothetical protein